MLSRVAYILHVHTIRMASNQKSQSTLVTGALLIWTMQICSAFVLDHTSLLQDWRCFGKKNWVQTHSNGCHMCPSKTHHTAKRSSF